MQDYFEDFFITLQNALPIGGISDEEAEERRKAIAERKEDRAKEAALDKKHIDNLKGAAMVTAGIKQGEAEAAKDANKAAAKEFSQRELNIKKMGGINDKEAGVRNEALKGKEEATKNLNDPIQMLLGEAKQQGKADAFQKQATAEAQAKLKAIKTTGAADADLSKAAEALGQIKTPESKAAAAAQGAKAGIEAKAEEKAAEAKKAEEKAAKEAAKPIPTEAPKPETAPGQTSGQTAIAQLNSNIEELVRLMRINNNLTSEQSSGLSRLAGSVTGDLFQV
jgi:colicin import membrane protein